MSTPAPQITVRSITNRDPGFYPLLGPYLSNRAVVRQVGGPIWDDPDKVWLVAGRRGSVRGFVAVARRGHTWVESLYCTEGYEHLAAELVAEAVAEAVKRTEVTELHAKVHRSLAPAYQAVGFVITDATANFTTLRWTRNP
jgi:hypothetical protein